MRNNFTATYFENTIWCSPWFLEAFFFVGTLPFDISVSIGAIVMWLSKICSFFFYNPPLVLYYLQSPKGNCYTISDDLSCFYDKYFVHAGDSLRFGSWPRGPNGAPFTTVDRDNDVEENDNNCAVQWGGGGWWYYNCWDVLLTGPYNTNRFKWRDYVRDLKAAVVMIRQT